MVDSPNYANSPLANPDFLNRVAPAPTADPGFAPMAPGIIDRAIAQEPVFQAKTLEERKRELKIEQARLRDRSAGEIISDSLLTGGNAIQSGLVPVGGMILKGIGAGVEALAEDGTILDDIGGLINDRAMIETTEMRGDLRDFLDQGKTDVALKNAQIDGQIGQINDEINLIQYKKDLADGDSEFIASLSLYGRQALDFTERMSDPVAGLDLTANAMGSLASGSVLAGIGSKIATSVAQRFGMEGVKKLGLEFGGSALGMGVTEASSTYAGVVEDVMGRTPEEMASSELYRELTGLGMGHEEAQAKVADSAGLDAFVNQLPAAMAAGLLSAKFNANPLSVMRGENPLGVFITAGKEALEETAQGATGQYNQNKAIRDFVDPNQALDEGVVDSAIGGLLGGFAASGIIGAPSGVRNGLQEQTDRIKEEVVYERFVQGMGEQIAAQRRVDARNAMTPEERDADLRAGMTQTSPAEDLFNSVVNKGTQVVDTVKNVAKAATDSEVLTGAVETVRAGVQSVKEAATPIVNKVIKAAQDYNEQGNPVIQNETVAAAESVVVDALDPAVETGNLGTPDTTVTKESLPEIFRDNVPESASLAETMTNIVKTIAEKKVPISSMTDDAILFVTQKFNDMQNAASTLAPEVQDKIKKVLASPDLERIRKRAARLDLNTAISSTIEKVSPTVKAMTVAMSKINPTNVNPDVVDKILKQEDRGDLTPEDIQDMEVAASVSRPMNQLINNIVKIEDDKNAFLVSSGQKPDTEENNFEKVSRRLIEGDPTNQEKLPSVKKTVNQIILGMRSPDKAVDVDGVRVPVVQVITHFKNLTQHMMNKVDALNTSFDQNDEKGVGPDVNFPTLSSKTGKFIPVGQAGSGNAVYNKRSIKSVTFAKTVGADAVMLVEVHNALAKAYPDQFPDGPIALPVLKTQESENTTAVESVPTPVGTDENAQTTQDVTPDQTPETQTVEDATPVASETDAVTEVTTLKEKLLKRYQGDLPEGWTVAFDDSEPGTEGSLARTSIANKTITINVKKVLADFKAGLTYIDGLEGQSSAQKKEVFKNIDLAAFKEFVLAKNVNTYIGFIMAHEKAHIQQHLEGRDYIKGNLMDPVNIAYEREANDAGFKQIGFVPKEVSADPNTETQTENKVSDRFVSVFRPKKNTKRLAAKEILDRIAEKDGTETYREFATILMGRISTAMNNRLQTVLLSKADGRSVAQALKEDQATILEYMKIKPMMIVDPETGRYNQELLDLASMAVIDWMTTARSYGADRLDDMLKELGLKYNDVPDDQIRDLLNSVPTRTTSESLAKKVIKLWAVQVNKDAQMVDIRGTTEGLVKEIFTVISQMEDPLVRIIELKTGEGRTASFEISNLKGEQEAIGLNAAGSLDKVLFPEDQIQASFGEKIAYVPKTQNNKADVPLSTLEQKATKKMQDTAHTEALPVVNFFAALGLDAWAKMAGKKDSSALGKGHPLRLTIEGKNTSIERDFETAFQMVTAAAGRPVFYPVGVTNVGRHQMKGINPQNNKLLRAMITPTHSKLNMLDNQKHKNAFWLTVAQSSGLAKVEKKMHTKILSTIQGDFSAKFGEATGIALAFLETGTLDTQSFAAAMLAANEGEEVGVAQVNAVLAVARLQQAQRKNDPTHLENFETSLSFELDGKTDGPANMMVAFGQGIMTRMEYQNFKRVGLFLGSKGETLNSLFSGGEVDLYEVNSTFADIRMTEMINSSTGMDKKRLMALQRFAARFGDFVINPDGTIQMSRATSKNPMTKKVYGSGENGIAEGIAQDMLVGFYTKLIALGEGQSVEDHLNYQEISQDLDLLFGVKLPDVLDVNNFILPNAKMKPFAEFVKETIGKILSESINEVMSEKTTGVNDLLVFSTGVQGQFMKLFFEQRLAEAMSELNEEYGEGVNQKKGKPALRKMPQSTYDAIVKETLAFAPYFADGLQNLRIGDFTGQVDNTEMSSNLSGNVRAKSTMARPDDMGVKAIPYVIQGRGDAMMMNRIFGADNAPERAIPIFDGTDIAITDFSDLADQINEAVLSNWDHDVLGPIVSNFDAFLVRVEEQGLGDKLQAAFSMVRADSKDKTSVTALDPMQLAAALAEARRLNQARKAVFKRITLAVDHMGGSGQAYIRNYDGKDLTFEEINDMIQDELDGIEPAQDPALPAPEVDQFAGVEDAEIVEEISRIVLPLSGTNQDAYRKKDQTKADRATKFIGRGSVRSSTNAYREAFGNRANTGRYSSNDVVFVSSEGNRSGRVLPDYAEIQKALDAGATIITDTPKDRNTSYNVGEQEVVKYLSENGYRESSPGNWVKKEDQEESNLVVTDVATVVEALIRETKPHLREVIRAIRGMLPDDARIIMGTEEQIAQWRKENLGQNHKKTSVSVPEGISANLINLYKGDQKDQDPWSQKGNKEAIDTLKKFVLDSGADGLVALARESKVPVSYMYDVMWTVFSNARKDFPFANEKAFEAAVTSRNLDQKTKGFYDVDNNIIFIMSDNQETIVHEMIHMATFQAVLDHYEGTKKSTAVKNLEVLMEEFLALDTATMSKEAQEAYFDAKRAIVKAQAEASPMGDAVALNEFMAWTLANDGLMRELKQTPTGLVARLTKVAKAWIQRILGVVPLDMYSHILFNTEMIRNDESDWDGTPPPPATPTVGVTPPADAFTNFWIDRLRDALEASKTPDGKNTQDKLIRYIATADDALVKLDFGGFSLSEYQKKTFVAIHAVIAAELRLDPNALIALGKVYEHITNNLTPQMFGTGQAAQDRYSTVMELMGATKNDEGISDAIAVMLALSQTSNGFRSAMEQIPQPAAQPGIETASLNDLLTSTTGFLMQKLIATTDTEGKGVKEILDALSDQILRQDNQNEFRALKALMGTFDKADTFVGGALSLLAQKTRDFNRGVQASQSNGILKVVSGSVALATAYMDKNTSAQAGKGAKAATHMDGMLDGAIFIRELVAEIVGADAVNSDTIQMLDKVTYVVQSTRQAYREELPVVLQNEFTTHPDAKQWKALHWVLGKTDFASLFDLSNPDDSFDMLNDQTLLDRRIKTRETKIMKAFPGQDGKNILEKAQQLADFMNGKGAGFQLMKNAYAIHKLAVGQNNKPNMVAEIDKLVSLYALNGTDIAQREAVAAMQASDPNGVHNLLVYVQALNKEEDQKIITEAARTNGYKGYIPDHGQGEVSLIIRRDTEREDLEKRGYVRVADDTTDSASLVSRGYYMTTVKQSGNYSQGVLQQVQDTYRGVNAVTGLTVNGTTSGVIAGVAVSTITDALNQSMRVADPKNVLLPVYDEDGAVLYYERGINPDLIEKYLQPESNMALMTGVWAGRQVEEKFSHEYNKALVQRLKEIWDNREPSTDGLFIRMDQAKDKIYAESWGVIPPQLKEHILATFGEDTGFMVRKDMINLSLGYRDPSITDVWTGNHRLPESVELAIKTVGKFTMGDKAYRWLANSESLTMNTISTAKDFIVVRSLVVPFMNTQSNVFQLVNRGVGTKQIMRGYKEKFAEIEKLNQNLKKIMGLQARIRLKGADKNQVAILKQQIQVLEDENERFSVSPLVKEGAYKNISEGITELDVSITDGKFGDWVESQLNRLPAGVKTVAKYGLLSKDTALYKGANKAVQYGDFVAKSIYYDDLRAKGLTHEAAMVKVNEEFINFSLLPGRTRTYLESMGATWFLTFKIRSMKVALQMMRDNPVRSLAAVGVFGLDSGPVTDNVATKALEGTLPYSLGWDMLWDAPSINPWWTVING